MNQSSIYHGGSTAKRKFSSSGGGNGGKYYYFPFCEDSHLVTGEIIPSPVNSGWASAGQGWYIPVDCKLREMVILVNRYATTSTSQTVTMGLRRITADGTQVGAVNASDGTFIDSHQLSFPDTSTLWRAFRGGAKTGIDITIPSGEMLFCYVAAESMSDLDGVNVMAVLQEIPG